MNKFKNIKIRNKLIISFVLISLVSGLTIYWGYQLALQRISDDALPTLQTIGQTTQLISDTQREAMEYFADDEEPEQLDDHIESLTITVNGLRKLSDDEDEVEPFNELANLASESADMSLRLVASHKNTKNNIESLGENLADNESLFQEISNRVDVEVEESIESGALDELIEDALPTKDSVNRLEDDIHLMELSVQSYLLTGDAEAARAYEDAKARAEATLTELEGTLEEDEANEGELLAALVVLLQETDTIGRATLDSHENTLALLEEMENLELRLNPIREVVTDYATRDVNEALASAQANVLIASAVALLFSFVLALFLSRAIASPIVRLTAVAQEISQGNLTVTAREESKDETGTLAHTFNNMTRQLRDLVENLEQRITDRTQDLNLAADIGRQVSQARELKDVLNEAVISMKDQFNLYQVQIYLADAKRENLILRASDGFAGSRLLETGHTLPINEQSLNGSAAYKKQAVIVSNTQESANFRPHPLLPDTRSEMVVPLLVEDDVLGVIDLQSTKANSLTEDVLPAFSVLAGQLAIAIMNARQNRTMQENQQLLRTIIDATPDWIFVKDQDHRYQLVNQSYADSLQLTSEQFIGKNDLDLGFPEDLVKGNQEKGIRGFWPDDQEVMDSGQIKIVPEEPAEINGKPVVLQTIKSPFMNADGKAVGVVGFVHDITNRKQAEEIIAKRADELQAVAELSTAVAATSDPQQLLQKTVNLAKERFALYHAHIYLIDEAKERLVLTAGAGEAGRIMVADGLSIPLHQEQSLVARAARTKEGVIVNDVTSDPDFLPNPLLPNTRSEMAVPMISGNELLGVLDVQSDIAQRFTPQDVQIQMTLASQTAVALQNARQLNTLQRTQESIRERETLLRTIIDSTPDWIFVKDSNHRYLMVNQGYADSLHMSPDDFIGKNDLDIGFPEDIVKGNPEKGIRGFWTDDREIMERGELTVIDIEPAVIDGEERFLNTIKAPLQDSEGHIIGIVGFVHDITNRIRSEELTRERESLLRTIINASPDWIFVKNREHRYELVNKAYADSFHLSPEQFIGQNDIELGFPEDIVKGNPEKGIRGFWPDDDDVMAAKQMKVIPEEPAEVDGKPVILRTIKAPLIDAGGHAAGVVGFVQDITDQKKTQEEQVKLAQELEEQLNQVNALQRAMTRENWASYINNQGKDETGYAFTGKSVEPFDSNSLQALTGGLPIDLDMLSQMAYDESQTAVIIPLQLHNENIGIVGARNANGDPINAEQNALLTTLIAQVAESLDRARLFEETEMARSQTDALFVGSENVVRATTMTDILAAFVQATALKNLDRASLLFFDKPWQDKDTPPESITATATWGIDDSIPLVDVGTTFPFAAFPGTQFLNRDIPNVIDDVLTNPRIDEGARRLFSEGLGVRSVIIIPLVAGDQWIGFVFGLSEYMYHMKENDIRQIMSLAGQAATVAQSQRLYQEASTRAEREQILRQVSDRVYAAPDAETVLRTAAREIGQALGLETYIYLENELTGDETLLTTK